MIGTWQRSLRIARLAIAARRVRKAKTPEARAAAQRELAEQMAEARGVPMKVGQILAGMGDDSSFDALTRSIDPWPNSEMLPVLERAWGRPASDILSEFEESHAAASLGQVHRGVLRDGTVVAIKIQYPDIALAIEAELRLAGMLPGAGPLRKWGFDLTAYKATLKENMDRELDYRSEGKRQKAFGQAVNIEGLHVPAIFEDLTHRNVLVQVWAHGERIADVAGWPLASRLRVAKTLMQTTFQSLFVHGVVHGDPHPGNALYERRDNGPTVHLLDYGCTVSIERPRRLALLKLIMAARGEDSIDALDGFVALGFDAEKLANLGSDLTAMMPLLFRPFVESRPFDSAAWTLGEDIATLLDDRRWWFRSAGPSDLLLLMRAFQGLLEQLALLEARLPFWPILTQSIPDALLQEAKAWTPPASGYSVADTDGSKATKLWVRIVKDGVEERCIAFPAYEALNLKTLIPSDVADIIRAGGVNLADLQVRVVKRGLVPQTLFSSERGGAAYDIWLD